MIFSVLLSIYSKEKPEYLNQAFISIWDHQTLKPSQIVLVQDGSLTASLELAVQEWKKKLGDVLTLVELPENVGLGAALTAGLDVCKHELVARMDTDDVALPERFEKQVTFMGENPDIVASSAILEEWNEDLTEKIGIRTLPLDSAKLKTFAKRRSPLSHPLSIYRRDVVVSLGGYPPLRKAQDYALWSLMLTKGYSLANLPDVLLRMRTGNDLLSRRGWEFLKHELALIKYQRDIGFLNFKETFANIIIRTCLRLSPSFIKRLAYKFARI